MRKVYRLRRQSFLFVFSFVLIVAFLLVACGSNGGGTGGAGGSANPSSTPTMSFAAANGCPNDTAVTTAPPKANVVVKPSNANATVTAHQGDVIEFDMPFGQAWMGPTASQGMLQLQTPAGYAWKDGQACVWRFIAQGTGTTQVGFYARAICKPKEACPQYIRSVPFTVTVTK